MPSPPGLRRLLRQLEERGVLRVAGVYAAGAFVVLQVADLVLPALPLPDGTYTVLVLLTLLGFPCAVAAAWLFDLTDEGVARAPAGIDAFEQALAPRPRRVRLFSAAMILALVVVAGGLLAFRTLWAPVEGDGRVAIAVFPFSASGAGASGAGGQWAEGVPDLLTTALDGTDAIRVLDPWALWTVLRDGPSAPARAPDPARAALIASDRGAHRYLLGSVVELGDRVEVVARLYRSGRSEPLQTFRVGGAPAELPALVDRLAVEVLTRVAGDAHPGLRAGLQRNATSSPEALKAYLAARSAMRRGVVDSAVVAVDRAVALDSTFALAWLESVAIYSWAQFMRGEFYGGLFEKLDRVDAYADSLSERNRLRAVATRAMVRTDGAEAATALSRIIELDSTDINAWTGLTYTHTVYGWQYEVGPDAAARAADRVIALDSAFVPALASRAWLAVSMGDTAAGRRTREALADHGGDSFLARSTRAALGLMAAPDSLLIAAAEELVSYGAADLVAAYRYLRVDSPERGELLLDAATRSTDPAAVRRATGELVRLAVARGHAARVSDRIREGELRDINQGHLLDLLLVAASLAGVGDAAAAARAVDALAAYIPPDSALAYFETRPVWSTAWAIGAYHAQMGDTARARRWQEVIGGLPEGGTSPDYRGALQSDIEARLSARAGDLDAAVRSAERALELWGIHTENTIEALPEPQMRFHLAMLRKAIGDPERARWLLRSLVPPTTWMGFLTARAWYELASLEEDAGELVAARRHYERVLALWEGGGDEIAEWREQARRGLSRTLERSAG